MTLIHGSRTQRLPGMAAAAVLAVLLPAGLATAALAGLPLRGGFTVTRTVG